MLWLGGWQFGRWQGRLAANAAISRQLALPPITLNAQAIQTNNLASLTYRRVQVSGRWDYANEVELRYRSLDGQAGVHLLTPLQIAGTEQVLLVDRGWIPYQEATNRRAYQQNDQATFEGLIYESQPQSTPSAEPGVVSQVDLAAIGAMVPYPLLPYWVQRLPVAPKEPLPRAVGPPDLSSGSHLAYTIQWWAFASTLVITYLIFANQSMRRAQQGGPRRHGSAPRP